MNFNPAPKPGDADSQGGRPQIGTARTGIAGRVESASKMRAPAPKGRGLVMMILGVVVLAALIWDFTGRGAASQAVSRSAGNGERPVAPKHPDERGAEAPIVAPTQTDGPLEIAIQLGNASLSLSAADAAQRLGALQGEDREAFRAQVLDALIKPAGRHGALGSEAFQTAALFTREAGAASQKALVQLRLRALVALSDDERAPDAILFLTQLRGGGGSETMQLLDEVILDDSRPLRLRIEAARARTDEERPAELEALAKNPATHPSLRDALTKK